MSNYNLFHQFTVKEEKPSDLSNAAVENNDKFLHPQKEMLPIYIRRPYTLGQNHYAPWFLETDLNNEPVAEPNTEIPALPPLPPRPQPPRSQPPRSQPPRAHPYARVERRTEPPPSQWHRSVYSRHPNPNTAARTGETELAQTLNGRQDLQSQRLMGNPEPVATSLQDDRARNLLLHPQFSRTRPSSAIINPSPSIFSLPSYTNFARWFSPNISQQQVSRHRHPRERHVNASRPVNSSPASTPNSNCITIASSAPVATISGVESQYISHGLSGAVFRPPPFICSDPSQRNFTNVNYVGKIFYSLRDATREFCVKILLEKADPLQIFTVHPINICKVSLQGQDLNALLQKIIRPRVAHNKIEAQVIYRFGGNPILDEHMGWRFDIFVKLFCFLAFMIDYMHSKKLYHNDLHLKNILVNTDRLFLIDFGYSGENYRQVYDSIVKKLLFGLRVGQFFSFREMAQDNPFELTELNTEQSPEISFFKNLLLFLSKDLLSKTKRDQNMLTREFRPDEEIDFTVAMRDWDHLLHYFYINFGSSFLQKTRNLLPTEDQPPNDELVPKSLREQMLKNAKLLFQSFRIDIPGQTVGLQGVRIVFKSGLNFKSLCDLGFNDFNMFFQRYTPLQDAWAFGIIINDLTKRRNFSSGITPNEKLIMRQSLIRHVLRFDVDKRQSVGSFATELLRHLDCRYEQDLKQLMTTLSDKFYDRTALPERQEINYIRYISKKLKSKNSCVVQ